MRVAIIIIDFGEVKLTQECLDSLAPVRSKMPVTVYLSGTEPRITEGVVNINLPKNGGFAYANNQAIAKALAQGCDCLVLLNNDTTVTPDFLEPLIRAVSLPKVGLVSPKIYFYPGNEFHHDDYNEAERGKVIWYAGGVIDWQNIEAYHWGVDEVDHGQFDSGTKTDYCTGCCLAINRELIKKIGLMREDYFMYFEDAAWSLKAQAAGYSCYFEPKAVIWHKNVGSGGSGSSLQVYYQTRNRIAFGLQYAPLRMKLVLMKSLIAKAKTAGALEKRAIRDGIFRNLGKRDEL